MLIPNHQVDISITFTVMTMLMLLSLSTKLQQILFSHTGHGANKFLSAQSCFMWNKDRNQKKSVHFFVCTYTDSDTHTF